MDLAADNKTENKSECFQLAMQASKKMDTFKDQENIIKEFLGNADTDVQNAAEVWLSIYYEHINDFDKAQKILDNTKLIGEYKLSMLFNLAAAYDDADYDDKALVIFHQIIKEFPEEEKEILEIIREMHNGSNNSDGELNKPTTESIVPEYFTTAYPNPFNASTTIAYNVPNSGHVKIHVYDILGREVKTLVDDVIEQGQNTITWNGSNDLNMAVATGVYFYRVQLEDHVLTNKILMLR
jgi:tetratricopeptide (TPR) repeat protein